MYEVDGICYAGTSAEKRRVTSVKPLKGGLILATFLSGEQRLFDTTSLTGSAFDALADEAVRASVKAEHGFISWRNGDIDLSPEYLYDHSIPYTVEDSTLLAG